ncbi:hypothetical protein [Phycicoccus avicenniae]|uniref:hypothetical protein n=1 Tax=Phycicoccus avicenniae TaxID=2828860 RepID=UPI003D2936B4
MRRTPVRHLALAAVPVAAVAVLVPLQSQAAGTVRERCSATIDWTGTTHVPGADPVVQTATYTKRFTVTTTTGFTDDVSTPTRQESFGAAVVGQDVTIGWFKDVSVFDFVSVDATVPLVSGRGRAEGRSVHGDSTRQDAVAWTVTCARP